MTGRIVPYQSQPGDPPAAVYWHEHQYPDYLLREVYLIRPATTGGLHLTYSHTERLIRGAKTAWYIEQATFAPPTDPGLLAGVVYAASQALVASLLDGQVHLDRGCVPVPALGQIGDAQGLASHPPSPAVSGVLSRALQQAQNALVSQPGPESVWQAVKALADRLRLSPVGVAAYAGGSVPGSITAVYRGGSMRSDSLARLGQLALAYGWRRIADYLERMAEAGAVRRGRKGGW